MAPIPGLQRAVNANIRKNPTNTTVRTADSSGGGTSTASVKTRASEGVRTAQAASAENTRTTRATQDSKLSKHYEISESIRNGTGGAVRGNDGWLYGVQKQVNYNTFTPGVAGNGWRNMMEKSQPVYVQQTVNPYAQLNNMYASQLGKQAGTAAFGFINNLINGTYNNASSTSGLDRIGGDRNVYSNTSSRSVSAPKDLTSASGIKSAVKNAESSADVFNAKQAADEVRTNLKDELSKIDFSETINSALDSSIGVDGSNKTLKDVLSDVGVTLDTSALGKIDVSSDDTTQIMEAIGNKLTDVQAFAKTIDGSVTKITTKSGEVKGTLNATNIRIEQLEAQISSAQTQGLDTTQLQSQLDQAKEQKQKLEIQQKELDAAKVAVEKMGTEADNMSTELTEMKQKFSDLQEVEQTADKKQEQLQKKEEKELVKLEKEAYDLKNKMDAEKDEGKKAKLKEKYDKTCAEFNQIAANTTSEGFAGRSIGENATESRTIHEQIDDHNQQARAKMEASMDAQIKQMHENSKAGWSSSTQDIVNTMQGALERKEAAGEKQQTPSSGNTPGYSKEGTLGFNNETGLPITYSGSTDANGIFSGHIGDKIYTSQKEFEDALAATLM